MPNFDVEFAVDRRKRKDGGKFGGQYTMCNCIGIDFGRPSSWLVFPCLGGMRAVITTQGAGYSPLPVHAEECRETGEMRIQLLTLHFPPGYTIDAMRLSATFLARYICM